jgi:hypothetical protein
MNTKRVVALHEDSKVIAALGGSAALARKLGYAQPHGTRRVNNWKYRGIPELIRLKRPDVFSPAPPRKARRRA